MTLSPKETPKSSKKGLKRAARNVVSMLTSNAVIRATNLLTYGLVAHYLGSYQLGQLALASYLHFAFHRFALLGLKTLTIRDVAKDKNLTAGYLMNASILTTISSLLGCLGLLLFLQVVDYGPDTNYIIILLFTSLVPFVLIQISEGVFQAWEKMQYIV